MSFYGSCNRHYCVIIYVEGKISFDEYMSSTKRMLIEQGALLLQRDRATRYANQDLVNCCTTIETIFVQQMQNKSK